MFEVGKPIGSRDAVTGQTFHSQEITHKPVKLAFRKKQTVIATITIKPATFTAKAVIVTEIYHDDFMLVVQKVQDKYPGKLVDYRAL